MAASAATAVPTAIRFNIAFSYEFRSFNLPEQLSFIDHVGARGAVAGNKHPHFFVVRTVIVQATGGMAHEFAGFQPDFFRVLPRFGAFARVPRPLQHDAVPLVRVCVRPAHRVRRESVDRQVEAGLAGIAFEDDGLHAKLVPLGRIPLELVDVGSDELARWERAELRLTIGAWRRRLLRVERHSRGDQRNGRPRCRCRNLHGTPLSRDYIRAVKSQTPNPKPQIKTLLRVSASPRLVIQRWDLELGIWDLGFQSLNSCGLMTTLIAPSTLSLK